MGAISAPTKNVLNYDVSKYPVLSSYLQDTSSVVGIRGPIGSGKSVASCVKILKNISEIPRDNSGKRKSRWLIVRTTYRELEDTTIKTWLEWVPENIFGIFQRQNKVHKLSFNDVEAEVLFRSLEDDADIRKLLSLELTGAWVNEAREIHNWNIIQTITSRMGRYPLKSNIPEIRWIDKETPYRTQLLMDTNPPDTEHWWYKLAEIKKPRDYTFYSQPSGLSIEAENTDNLPKNYYTKHMEVAEEDWIKVYIEGQYGFIVEGKRVYPEYKDNIHCTENAVVTPGSVIYRGFDFGLTPSCVMVQQDSRGRLVCFDEILAENMGIDRFSDFLIQYCKQNYPEYRFADIGDPAGMQRAQTDEKSCFQILQTKGINIEPGKQSPKIRLESVKKALNTLVDGTPGFILNPKCRVLREGFLGAYQYKKISTASIGTSYADKPIKNYASHPHDALQYICAEIVGDTLIEPAWYRSEESEEQDYSLDVTGRSQLTGY